MSLAWKQQRERSSPLLIGLFVWMALRLGRRSAHFLLGPIVLYFFATSAPARRASREFLRRAAAPAQGAWGVLRQMHAFAACGVDRLFLLCGRYDDLRVTVHDPENLLPHYDRVGGAIIPTAHLGSFEVLRVLGVDRKGLRMRIVMDRGHNGTATALLERLNPQMARDVIDSGAGGPTLPLMLAEALRQGDLVGLMADRVSASDRGVSAPFFGVPARWPDSPWRLVGALGAPVVLCFGLYRGGGHYELHFERFIDGNTVVPRAARAAFVEQCVQRYAARLEHYARLAPYNWFNFYDFWKQDDA